jgi:hypothetical protein
MAIYATFSVSTWGLRLALMQAIEARRQMEQAAEREARRAQSGTNKRRA